MLINKLVHVFECNTLVWIPLSLYPNSKHFFLFPKGSKLLCPTGIFLGRTKPFEHNLMQVLWHTVLLSNHGAIQVTNNRNNRAQLAQVISWCLPNLLPNPHFYCSLLAQSHSVVFNTVVDNIKCIFFFKKKKIKL